MSFGTRKNAITALSIVSVTFFLSSAVMLATAAPIPQNNENSNLDVIMITEHLEKEEQYLGIFPAPPYAINLTGYWNTDIIQSKLQVKIAPSDVEDFEEMKHAIEDSLSESHGLAGNSTDDHGYERWNDLLSINTESTIPMLSIKENGSNYDILIQLTDEVHPNGRTAGQTMLYLDGRQIVSAEITIYNAGQLYKHGELIAITKHELGHALGLGHSNYFGSIMYPSLVIIGDELVGTISDCETQGIKSVYSSAVNSVECHVDGHVGNQE